MRRVSSPGEMVAVDRGKDRKSRRAGGTSIPIPPGRGDHLFDTESGPHLGRCSGLIIRLRGRSNPDGFDSPAFRFSLKTPVLLKQARGNHKPGGFAQNVTSQHHSSESRHKIKGIRDDCSRLSTRGSQTPRPRPPR